jgi:acyl carrier protein
VSSLKLEDLTPDDIGSDEALFGDTGLGLDSIDALELGVAIRKTYNITIETVSDEVKHHFSTVNTLAAFIRVQQGSGQ